MRFTTPFAVLALAALTACTDRPPTSPVEPPPFIPTPDNPAGATQVDCVASVSAGTVSCAAPTGSGARYAIIGGQGEFLNITATGVSFNSGTGIFQGNFTVQNLLPYPIGTRDGVSADSGGVKVFIYQGPTATGGSGDVTVANPDGLGTLTAANQPFFKYAQMIKADSVSAPKNWQFQLDPGVTNFTFSLLVYAETQPSAFRVILPEANDTVLGDTLEIRVVAAAPPQMRYLEARVVGATSTYLAYADNGIWKGKLSLSGNAGPRTLRVKGTGLYADTLVQTVPFVYGIGPTLTLTHPAFYQSVSGPQVRFAGTCTDNTSCTVTGRLNNSSIVVFTASGPSFDETVTFTDGTRDYVRITGTDTDGNTATVVRGFTIEASPRLVEVSPGRQVYAASPDAFFYRDSSASGAELRLRQRTVDSTDALVLQIPPRTTVLQESQWTVGHARITPAGVLFFLGPGWLNEYANGSMFSSARGGDGLNEEKVYTAGRYWTYEGTDISAEGGPIVLRDVIAGTRTTVGLGYRPHVAENGDLVYEFRDTIRHVRNGVRTAIYGPAAYPKTDGNLIAFLRGGAVMLYNPSGEPLIVGVQSTRHYDLNNGWLAFHGHVRAPDGIIHPLIRSGLHAIRAVGPAGQVIYQDGERRWYSEYPYGTRVDVGRDWGERVYFHGNRAFVTVGEVATFEIVP